MTIFLSILADKNKRRVSGGTSPEGTQSIVVSQAP